MCVISLVPARHMQIPGEARFSRYRNGSINVRRGPLPAFKGVRPYQQVYGHGVKTIGATSHYTPADLDMGPINEQQTVRVDPMHSVETLVAMGCGIEPNVLSAAVKARANDRIMVCRRSTIEFR